MKNSSLRKQIQTFMFVLASSAVVAAGITAVLFGTFVPLYVNEPISQTGISADWAHVPAANYFAASGPGATFCLTFVATYLTGLALGLFPPAPRMVRVRS